MLNRRLFLSALLCAPATVFAAEGGFLGDILGGIADRALRDYVGQHFGDARWDGRYYNYDDHRYTRDEWPAISKSATAGSAAAVFAVFVTTMAGTTMMTTMTTTVGAAAVRVGTGMTTMTMIDRFSCGREVESLPCAHVP